MVKTPNTRRLGHTTRGFQTYPVCKPLFLRLWPSSIINLHTFHGHPLPIWGGKIKRMVHVRVHLLPWWMFAPICPFAESAIHRYTECVYLCLTYPYLYMYNPMYRYMLYIYIYIYMMYAYMLYMYILYIYIHSKPMYQHMTPKKKPTVCLSSMILGGIGHPLSKGQRPKARVAETCFRHVFEGQRGQNLQLLASWLGKRKNLSFLQQSCWKTWGWCGFVWKWGIFPMK